MPIVFVSSIRKVINWLLKKNPKTILLLFLDSGKMFILEVQNLIKMKQLTVQQKYIIFRLKQSGKTQSEIASSLGYSQSAISKELKKGITKRGNYSPVFAQEGKKRFKLVRKFTKELENLFVKK